MTYQQPAHIKNLKERLMAFFLKRSGQWIASGTIEDIVREKTSFTGSSATRCLRKLRQDGFLDVQNREKQHAWYRLHEDPIQEKLFNL